VEKNKNKIKLGVPGDKLVLIGIKTKFRGKKEEKASEKKQ
jgi:hypothetical protein